MAKKISAADCQRIQRKAALARARRAFLKRQAQEADEPEEKKKDEEEPDMEAKKRECARLRRRAQALNKRAQEIEDTFEDEAEEAPAEEPEAEEVEARKRLQARRKAAIKAAAKRRAMKRKAQEAEEIPADIEPEPGRGRNRGPQGCCPPCTRTPPRSPRHEAQGRGRRLRRPDRSGR